MNNTRRTFVAASVTEQADGSAVLLVRSQKGRTVEDYEIHFAPHIWADLGFLFYSRYAQVREQSARKRERERRLDAKRIA